MIVQLYIYILEFHISTLIFILDYNIRVYRCVNLNGATLIMNIL